MDISTGYLPLNLTYNTNIQTNGNIFTIGATPEVPGSITPFSVDNYGQVSAHYLYGQIFGTNQI